MDHINQVTTTLYLNKDVQLTSIGVKASLKDELIDEAMREDIRREISEHVLTGVVIGWLLHSLTRHSKTQKF